MIVETLSPFCRVWKYNTWEFAAVSPNGICFLHGSLDETTFLSLDSYSAATIMIFLVAGNFITGNVDSLWSWIEVSFLTLLAIYFAFYATRARRNIEK